MVGMHANASMLGMQQSSTRM